MQQKTHSRWIIVLFALIKLLIPFFLIQEQFELHRDEYLYLADADHLAWGYIEMPPFLAVLGYISNFLGGGIYLVRIWPAIFGALTVWIIGKIVLQLKGNPLAVFVSCAAFLCSGFLRMHILFQPNFLDVFFWTFSSYCLVCFIDTKQHKYLYYLGIGLGLGVLGKYTTLFYIFSLTGAILLSGQRRLFLNKHFYLAILVGMVICLPNFLWQYRHHFPVMHHMDLLSSRLLKHNTGKDFIINQFLMTLPSFFVWLGGLWFLFTNPGGRKYLLLGMVYFGIIGILIYFNGKAYYAAAIYPTLMAFGGVWFSQLSFNKWFGWVKWFALAGMFVVTLLTLPLALPFLSPQKLVVLYKASQMDNSSVLSWEDGKQHPLPQDFADMLGWKEMAIKTAKIYHALPDSVKRETMVYGDNYGEAGALSFYGKKLGLPEIYSDNASYIFWLPEKFNRKYFLFVCDQLPEPGDAFFSHWGKSVVIDSVTQNYARESGAKIILYSNPDDSVRIIAEEHIRSSRKQFNFQ